MCADHLAEGVVHTSVERYIDMAVGVLTGLHVKAGAERRHAVGGGAHAALHINRTDGRCEVGHIYPEHRLTLRVIERHVVDGHVDARVIRAADAEVGVTHAQTVVAGDLQSRDRG